MKNLSLRARRPSLDVLLFPPLTAEQKRERDLKKLRDWHATHPRPSLTPEQKTIARDRARAHIANKNGHAPPPLEKDCRPRPAGGCCEACFNYVGVDQLVLDHDHVTGAFRGWICDGCNTGVGALGDTLDSVQLALDYMAFHAPR
jgi:hypothetical protein